MRQEAGNVHLNQRGLVMLALAGLVTIALFMTYSGMALRPAPASAAALLVTTSANDGAGSLREAIGISNASGEDDVITFSGDLDILLDAQLLIDNDNDNTLTIDASDNQITVNAQSTGRVFQVNAGSGLTLIGLTVTGGAGPSGAGILNNGGVVILDGSTVSDNSGTTSGGGIANVTGGRLTLRNGTVSDNSATLNGGGIYNDGGTVEVLQGTTVVDNRATNGGGIYNSNSQDSVGIVQLTQSTIEVNDATDSGGGIYNDEGTLQLVGSNVRSNTADSDGNGSGDGGGIHNSAGTVMIALSSNIGPNNGAPSGAGMTNTPGGMLSILSGSRVVGNNAELEGGGTLNDGVLEIVDSFVSDNTITGPDIFIGGGGILNGGAGEVTITGSTVSGNSASEGDGGGIYNRQSGTVRIVNSTVGPDNVADPGGGIYNTGQGFVILTNSTVDGNRTEGDALSSNGGGIYNGRDARFDAFSSTISNNSTVANGGGLYNEGTANLINSTVSGNSAPDGDGGGIFNTVGQVSMANVTVAENSAQNGGGLYEEAINTYFLVNTIVANNTPNNCGGNTAGFFSNNSNLFDDSTCNDGPGDIVDTDAAAGIGPLATNDGPTQTHALLPGSQAIDNGNDGVCQDPGVTDGEDQRGVERPQGPQCDIGAYERLTAPDIDVDKQADDTSVPASGQDVTYTVTVTSSGDNAVTLEELTDDQFGDLNGAGSCVADGSVVIAPGTSYECEFTEFISGEAGDEHVNEVTAVVMDTAENEDSASDRETVRLEEDERDDRDEDRERREPPPNIGGILQFGAPPQPFADAPAPARSITPPDTGDAGLR